MSQAGGALVDDVTQTTALLSAIIAWIYTVIIVSLGILQTVKVSQDLLSDTKRDANYRLIQCATVVVIYFCMLSVFAGDLLYLSQNDAECATRWTLVLNFQQFAKTLTYFIILARLYRFYGGTKFEINPKTLFKFGIAVVVIGVMGLIGIVLFPINAQRTVFPPNSYPSWCIVRESGSKINLFYVAGAILIAQDITAAIVFGWLYNNKWNRIEEEIQKKFDDIAMRDSYLYFASKARTLTATMLFGTIILTLLSIITGLGVFAQTDLVNVPVCLILMTPYYPDTKYYSKLCCLCHLACCGKGKASDKGVNGVLINNIATKAGDQSVEQPQVEMPGQTQTSAL